MFVVLIVVVRRIARFKVPWISIGKYIGASVAMALFLEAFSVLIPQPITLFVLAATVIGGLICLGVLMAIDKEARALPRLVLKQLRGANKQEP